MHLLSRTVVALVRDEGGIAFIEYAYALAILLSISLAVLAAASSFDGEMSTAPCSMMLAMPGTSIAACTPS